jgi:predicted DNA-binding transcriptional regulator AlpA
MKELQMTQALSISDFCKQHSISRALFYRALKEGWAPKIMKCGKRTLISIEAAAEWRRKMETQPIVGV